MSHTDNHTEPTSYKPLSLLLFLFVSVDMRSYDAVVLRSETPNLAPRQNSKDEMKVVLHSDHDKGRNKIYDKGESTTLENRAD